MLREQLAPLRQRPRRAGAQMIQAVLRRLGVEQRDQRARHVGRVDVIGIAERRGQRPAPRAGALPDVGRRRKAGAPLAPLLPPPTRAAPTPPTPPPLSHSPP